MSGEHMCCIQFGRIFVRFLGFITGKHSFGERVWSLDP